MFSLDGKRIVSGSDDGTIKVWVQLRWSRTHYFEFIQIVPYRVLWTILFINKTKFRFSDDILDLVIEHVCGT